MKDRKRATYQVTEEIHGNGMFFFTDCCGNRMYSIRNDEMLYHGCLCPKCFWEGVETVLYLRGTPEANEVMKGRGEIATMLTDISRSLAIIANKAESEGEE